MQLALLSLLLVTIALLVMRAVSRERRSYTQFKRLRSSARRREVYARWLRDSFFVFGGLSGALLLAAWPYVPAVSADAREAPGVSWVADALATGPGGIVTIVIWALLAAALVVPVFLLRGNDHELATVGDISALLPRTRAELGYGAALAINAGLVEELLFRFAMPALIFGIVGNGVASFVIASVVFGLLHLYQGPAGVLTSVVLGLLFSAVYLLSGSLLLVIVLHAAFDLRSLVLIPVVVQGVWAKRG